ncbi:MAG TPA: hypothetical protein VGF50_14435 [Caulobacteraceae bacterium]|jgi:hypothetical protein
MSDSRFDQRRLGEARRLLAAPAIQRQGLGDVAAAAALFAIAALALAATVVMMPTPWPV